jgi:hypothetical protein
MGKRQRIVQTSAGGGQNTKKHCGGGGQYIKKIICRQTISKLQEREMERERDGPCVEGEMGPALEGEMGHA